MNIEFIIKGIRNRRLRSKGYIFAPFLMLTTPLVIDSGTFSPKCNFLEKYKSLKNYE